jgi:TRAP-type C4-dicarboxylate transport system permease small subunit
MFDLYDRATRGLIRVGYWVAVIAALGLMVIGGMDVLGTYFLGKPVPSALELQEVLLAIMVFMGLSHAQSLREHISVEIVVHQLPARVQRVLDLVVLVASAIVFGIIAWRCGELAWSSLKLRETASASFAFPVYPAKICVAVGAALAALECLRQAGWWFRGGESPRPGAVDRPEPAH